jgi:hypothetical protein
MGDPLHDHDWDESGMRIRAADAHDPRRSPQRSDAVATRKPVRAPAPTNDAQTVRPPRFVPTEAIPVVAVDLAELRQLSLDPHSGFLLSLMDGSTSVETLLDVCGMPSEEAMRRLDHLVMLGVVRLT